MKYWKKYSKEKLIKRIDEALASNVNFLTSKYLGYPVSKLDENVFTGAFQILPLAGDVAEVVEDYRFAKAVTDLATDAQ